MRLSPHTPRGAFTLLELTVAVALSMVAGLLIATYLSGSSLLFAKNVSTNLTHTSVRSTVDKMTQDISLGCSAVTRIDASGDVAAAGVASAGIRFDSFRGGPYVVTHPGGTGLTATSNSLIITRSTEATASPPIPTAGDVILIDGAPNVRLVVSSVSAGVIDSTTQRQALTVTLASPAGTAIPWLATRTKLARLVRRKAYVVIPSNGRNELRYFPAAEAITNFATSTNYALVVKNVGIDIGDSTPFTTATLDGKDFLRITLRMRSDQYGNRLANKEANKFSAIQRVECLINPRGT